MRIIPAIDIIEGKCVRLSKGDYDTKKIYNENPLEVAKNFEAHGIEYLHLVDLDGAKSKHIVNHKILDEIASKTNLKIDFGGGLKSNEDLRIAFESGANQITGGSIAVKDKMTFLGWLTAYGSDKIVLGADAFDEKVAVSGWQEESKEELIPAFSLYKKILSKTKVHKTIVTGAGVEDFTENGINLIASGGISSFDELPKLKEIGCEGVIIGKAIYENRISLKQLEQYILENG